MGSTPKRGRKSTTMKKVKPRRRLRVRPRKLVKERPSEYSFFAHLH